ncbi:MAG: 50S ribosomal protein L18 [Candidatus Sungbacteria bacterium]|nr:50S ribosomal protein L18 [bacterium]MDZ4260441.1 50S ribosomal protein L18 [Candidatus Sungbacteria bacterium]
MKTKTTTKQQRIRRHARVRAIVKGTSGRPRLSVFRSNRHIWVQLIDDIAGKTLAHASDWDHPVKGKKGAQKESPVIKAEGVGEKIAKLAVEKKISNVVFDRGGYRYHGRVKAIAEGMRKAGIQL